MMPLFFTRQTALMAALAFASLLGCATRKSSVPATADNKNQAPLDSPTPIKKWPKAALGFLENCGSKLTQVQYEELLELSDNSTFTNYTMAEARSEKIAKIFAEAKDRRGIFSSMYVEITKESVGSTSRGEYADSKKAGELVKRFAERYFQPLHLYLLSGDQTTYQGKVTDRSKIGQDQKWTDFAGKFEWETYYALTEECSASDLRILGTGVNNHMTTDLPNALAEISAPASFKDDFMKFGNILIEKKRQSTNLLISQQNVYAAAFFDLFIVGAILDKIFGVGTASKLGFQLIRAEAWRNGRALQAKEPEAKNLAQLGVLSAWKARQLVLATMPKSNSSMVGTEEK